MSLRKQLLAIKEGKRFSLYHLSLTKPSPVVVHGEVSVFHAHLLEGGSPERCTQATAMRVSRRGCCAVPQKTFQLANAA